MGPYRRLPEVARRQALDYLRQTKHPLADAARDAIEAGDIALAFAIVSCGLQPAVASSNLQSACAEYARKALVDLRTPDLPSVSRARWEAWRARQEEQA